MRTLLIACIGLTFVGSLAAQSQVPREQCLGGWLVAIQQDSISLKFNEKISTMRLAPGAEIWRRGVDLESLDQLDVGDQIYTECTRVGGSGPVMASVVAAVEKDEAVRIEPHHIVEYGVCGGHLVAVAKDSLSVKNDDGICSLRINADTAIGRGEIYHDTSALELGDDVMARFTVGYPGRELTAEEVWANLANTEGTVVAMRTDRIVVNQDVSNGNEHLFHPHVHVTVLFDARTSFDLDEGKLKKAPLCEPWVSTWGTIRFVHRGSSSKNKVQSGVARRSILCLNDFRLLPSSAPPGATFELSAPSPWKRILRLAVLGDSIRHQIDFRGLGGKHNPPFRRSPVAASLALRRLRRCDML